MQSPPPYAETGKRIRDLREARGLSRRDLAAQLTVSVSSLGGWEDGKRLPRERVRLKLARALGTDLAQLFALGECTSEPPMAACTVDTIEDLQPLLIRLTERTRHRLRAIRLASPYVTSAHVQVEWRNLVSRRILDKTLELDRIEIFYDLRRLQETLSNILRYDGCRYYVKSYCAGIKDVAPAIGGYMFDDDEFLLGGYWKSVPPTNQPSLRVSGPPFRTFFNAYWHEIWQRGTLLNIRGAHDLSAVRECALKLGLEPQNWDKFVEVAKTLQVGDGAPPLV